MSRRFRRSSPRAALTQGFNFHNANEKDCRIIGSPFAFREGKSREKGGAERQAGGSARIAHGGVFAAPDILLPRASIAASRCELRARQPRVYGSFAFGAGRMVLRAICIQSGSESARRRLRSVNAAPGLCAVSAAGSAAAPVCHPDVTLPTKSPRKASAKLRGRVWM